MYFCTVNVNSWVVSIVICTLIIAHWQQASKLTTLITTQCSLLPALCESPASEAHTAFMSRQDSTRSQRHAALSKRMYCFFVLCSFYCPIWGFSPGKYQLLSLNLNLNTIVVLSNLIFIRRVCANCGKKQNIRWGGRGRHYLIFKYPTRTNLATEAVPGVNPDQHSS